MTTLFELDAEQVEETFKECLSDHGECEEGDVDVEGIVFDARFDRAKLAEHAELIGAMLLELPEPFRESIGGGWSFLQACDDRHGRQWTGLHQTMSMLFMLGEGLGLVTCPMGREYWPALPGGVPYYIVNDRSITREA